MSRGFINGVMGLIVCAQFVQAELKLPFLFTDGAVLQQETGAKVWGWGDAGAEVTVNFAGQELATKVGQNGKWKVNFKGLKASTKGAELKITSGSELKVVKDVVVGEVWIASGQSNMEWRVAETDCGKKEITTANDPLLRVFTSANVACRKARENWWGAWRSTTPKKTGSFTAVGYYFGKRLRSELKVPVGIIECSWGGKPVEAFTSVEALRTLPEAKGLMDKKAQAIANWNPKKAKADFEKKKEDFEAKLAKWKKDKKGKKPRGPRKPMDPQENPGFHSTIYNGMIAPMVGYGVRGAIWYQGEANAKKGVAQYYEELLGCMVTDWRKRWGYSFSFYWVQLANFRKPTNRPGVPSDWVTVQDEMRRALKSIPHSGMAVINEIGAANDIHPRNKKDVGNRLARWALVKDYGKKGIILCGPLYAGVEQKDNKLILTFDHAQGLKTRDGKPPQRFEIAAEDGTWQWAQASIENGKVIVWHDKISKPVKARYAWASNPQGANLVNQDGLPASCFTTE